MWYRAKGWDAWLALGYSAGFVWFVAFQRWWLLLFHTAWLIGYLLWRRNRQLPPVPSDLPAPVSAPTTSGPDGTGWTCERNADGSYTWRNADGRRVVID